MYTERSILRLWFYERVRLNTGRSESWLCGNYHVRAESLGWRNLGTARGCPCWTLSWLRGRRRRRRWCSRLVSLSRAAALPYCNLKLLKKSTRLTQPLSHSKQSHWNHCTTSPTSCSHTDIFLSGHRSTSFIPANSPSSISGNERQVSCSGCL